MCIFTLRIERKNNNEDCKIDKNHSKNSSLNLENLLMNILKKITKQDLVT